MLTADILLEIAKRIGNQRGRTDRASTSRP
jgi:hypothetical protein